MSRIAEFARFAAAQGVDCSNRLCDTGLPKVDANSDQVAKILQIVFASMGAITLIYILIAAFQLMTSLGNPEALAKIRQSIIYAAIGLAIILSAEIIVTLVISRI